MRTVMYGQLQRVLAGAAINIFVRIGVGTAFCVRLSVPSVAVACRIGLHVVGALKLNTTGGNVVHTAHRKTVVSIRIAYLWRCTRCEWPSCRRGPKCAYKVGSPATHIVLPLSRRKSRKTR